MDGTQKLEKIEQLVRYSGLEMRRARELLEKTGWNVDSAYRLYQKGLMDQRGYKVNSNRYSEPVSTSRPMGHHPATSYLDGLGPVLTGMGPATHPAFLPPQPVPKFPVERPQERIIPIQIEGRPSQNRLERQDPVRLQPSTSRPVQVTTQPRVSYPGATTVTVKGDYFPNQAKMPQKGDNFPFQLIRGSKPVQGVMKNEVYPNQMQRGSNIVENAKEQPVFTVGEDEPQSEQKPGNHGNQQQPVQVAKTDNVDAGSTTPKLKRGISKISQNALLVDEERVNILQDIAEDCHDNMYVQTFVLPDVTGYAEDFRAFLEKDLIETSTLVSLEQAGRLNWWAEMGICQRLIPMATTGDGNCLLHAASLAMWGIHDRQLMLRKALYDTLTKKYYRQALYRRWRWQQTQANKQAGLIFSEEEWKAEWDNVLRLASTTPRALPGNGHRNNSCCDSIVTQTTHSPECHSHSPVVYESLEEFHVFVLAHVIQRPIIIVADTILKDSSGEALAPIPFGGIYLPLECDAGHCYRSPLLLTYDAAHFSALVPMEESVKEKSGLPVAIPIVGPTFEKLPIHFSIDPGINYNWEKNNASIIMSEESKLNLLKRYLDMEKLPITFSYTDSSSDKNSTGSYESDDGLVDKKDKKKDNSKVSQQIQSVGKQFGSFGKSMGKKLKNLGKGNKEDKKQRKPSLTQSTKIPLTIAALGELDQQCIWCCKLTSKRSDTHQKMVDNYLFDAGERFKSEKALRNLKHNEIISRANNKANISQSEHIPCVTSGCQLYGSASTSYLCAKCFEEHKRHALDHEKDMYDTYSSGRNSRQLDDVKKYGKSKFYDMQDGSETVADKLSQVTVTDTAAKSEKVNNIPGSLIVDLRSKQDQRSSRNVDSQPAYPREPSPDYDNVEYSSAKEQALKPVVATKPNAMQTQPKSPKLSKSPKLQPKVDNKGTSGVKCRTENCDFYGNKDMDYYCSRCYKSQPLVDLSTV